MEFSTKDLSIQFFDNQIIRFGLIYMGEKMAKRKKVEEDFEEEPQEDNEDEDEYN